MHFLLTPSSRGVMGAPIHLLRESRRARLMHVADRWAKPLLSVRVVPVAGGSCSFMILSLPRMIPCTVHERSSLCLSDGISCKVPVIKSPIWPFHSLLHAGTTMPFFAFCFSHRLSILAREMAHGDDCGKCPRDEGSSHGSGLSPPHQMMMVAGAHWVHTVRR
jgi:hypothetical protein